MFSHGTLHLPTKFREEPILTAQISYSSRGADSRIRTDDQRFTKPLLYH